MSDIPSVPSDPSIDPPPILPSEDETPVTPTPDASTYPDLAAIISNEVDRKLEEMKVNNILVGWVTGITPLTVRLLDGEDIQPVLQSSGFVLALNDKVGLKHSVNGYIITEQLISIGSPVTFGMVPVGALLLWPRNTTPPPGWYVANGTNGTDDYTGKVAIGAGTGFTFGATGGSTTHTHSQSLSTSSTGGHSHSISGNTNDTGTHNHGGTDSGGSHNHGNTGSGDANRRGVTESGTNNENFASHSHSTSNAGGHSHGISNSASHAHGSGSLSASSVASHSHSVSGSPATTNHMPPYKVLHYIQFLGV